MAILAGDIGGTKSRLILTKDNKVILKQKFYNRYYTTFSEVLKDLLIGNKLKINRACFGIAGPIFHNRCEATNLPWVIDGATVSREFNIHFVKLINDMEANAYGIPCLKESGLIVLNTGKKGSEGNAALISAGTGLGEAGLFWDGKHHHPFASEGSHVDFAPRNEMEVQLWWYLKNKYGHVSYEWVISGMGISNLYRFLIDKGLEKKSPAIEQVYKEGGDPPKVISEKALKGEDRACVRVMEWFVSLYASEAGNLALKYLCKGGVFLGGGIAPKTLHFFKKDIFMKAFADKGRFHDMLLSFPVKIILNDDTALLGATAHANDAKD